LAEDGTAALRKTVWSPDGKFMAYQVSRGGSDWVEIYLKDCETFKDLDDHLKWVKFSCITWTKDNLGFFYQKYDAPKSFENKDDAKAGTETDKDSAHKAFYHRVGTK
jgi:prolyl oligopeptidase